MNVLGHGIDTVDTARFEKLFGDQHSKYLKRYFTDSELGTVSSDETAFSRLAARFAAKEAVMKALRHGFGDGLAFTHIEIKIEADGAPTVVLHNKASEIADKIGIRQWWISISHSGDVAFASAIACG
ncbi:holo-ACP synthase [Thalassospira alkalitolerans]|uniref:holo-ACP synthase n=1 Tax=Thalassospira alkalitolerans TaxID=1293890 RepID=UPI003AA9B033|tara:strand:- start:221 stop:601 length:381 start_codon:yes stop_codon:yes gene_type:complete